MTLKEVSEGARMNEFEGVDGYIDYMQIRKELDSLKKERASM
jgi:hypothetical protein